MRRLALLAAVSLFSTSACTMTSSGRSTLLASGAIVAAAGVALVAAGPEVVDSNGNGHNGTTLNDDYSGPALGVLALTAGIVMLVSGAASDVTPTYSEPLPQQPQQFAGPPGKPTRVVDPLPEVPVDAETLRLAKQTRIVVNAGHCEAARPLLADIEVRSPVYHHALVEGPVIDPCPSLRYVR